MVHLWALGDMFGTSGELYGTFEGHLRHFGGPYWALWETFGAPVGTSEEL